MYVDFSMIACVVNDYWASIPLWHYIVKDHWLAFPFGIVLWKTNGLAFPFGTVLWKTIGLASPLALCSVHEHAWGFMWCFKLFSWLDVFVCLWGWTEQHICIQLQLNALMSFHARHIYMPMRLNGTAHMYMFTARLHKVF
jgi:hypothetical protein